MNTITPTDDKIFRECRVLYVNDDKGGLRIRVRITPDDNNTPDNELPYCFPLLPKHLHVNPKVGERVLVILSTLGVTKSRRWFIGPVISQQYNLYNDPMNFSSQSLLDNGDGIINALPNPELNPDNIGGFPDREDIAIQGRHGTDVILKDNEIKIRCGFLKNDANTIPSSERLIYNYEDLAYIQMRYKQQKDHNDRDFASSINIVADRINLLSYDTKFGMDYASTSNKDDKYTRKDLITDDKLLNILENTQRLPYGDKLVELLSEFIRIFKEHKHPFPLTQPSLKKTDRDILNTENIESKLLSESVRIN